MALASQWWLPVLVGGLLLAGLPACDADLETRCVGGDGTCDAQDYTGSPSATSGGVEAGSGGGTSNSGGQGGGPGGAGGVGGAGNG